MFGKLRQGDCCKFEFNQSYRVKPYLKNIVFQRAFYHLVGHLLLGNHRTESCNVGGNHELVLSNRPCMKTTPHFHDTTMYLHYTKRDHKILKQKYLTVLLKIHNNTVGRRKYKTTALTLNVIKYRHGIILLP